MGSFVEGEGLCLGSVADFCFAQQGIGEADVGVELDTTSWGCGVSALARQVWEVGESVVGKFKECSVMSMRCCWMPAYRRRAL